MTSHVRWPPPVLLGTSKAARKESSIRTVTSGKGCILPQRASQHLPAQSIKCLLFTITSLLKAGLDRPVYRLRSALQRLGSGSGKFLGVVEEQSGLYHDRGQVIRHASTILLDSYDPLWLEYIHGVLGKNSGADLVRPASNSDLVFAVTIPNHVGYDDLTLIYLGFAYLLVFLYVAFSLGKIKLVKSRWGLAIVAVLTVVFSFLMALGLCSFFSLIPSTLKGSEVFPYLVVVIGLENLTVIVHSVLGTPAHLAVSQRVAQGLSKEGWPMTKNLFLEVLVLTGGYLTWVPLVQEFCVLAVLSILSDFFLQMVFFTTVLSVDIRRMELIDLQDVTISREFAYGFNLSPHPQLEQEPPLQSSNRGSCRLLNATLFIMNACLSRIPFMKFLWKSSSNVTSLPDIPKRHKFLYIWARTRIFQHTFTLCAILLIGHTFYSQYHSHAAASDDLLGGLITSWSSSDPAEGHLSEPSWSFDQDQALFLAKTYHDVLSYLPNSTRYLYIMSPHVVRIEASEVIKAAVEYSHPRLYHQYNTNSTPPSVESGAAWNVLHTIGALSIRLATPVCNLLYDIYKAAVLDWITAPSNVLQSWNLVGLTQTLSHITSDGLSVCETLLVSGSVYLLIPTLLLLWLLRARRLGTTDSLNPEQQPKIMLVELDKISQLVELSVSNDRYLVTATIGGKLFIWEPMETPRNKVITRNQNETSPATDYSIRHLITSMEFLHQSVLCVGCHDGYLEVYSLPSRHLLLLWVGRRVQISHLARISSDLLCAGYLDGTISVLRFAMQIRVVKYNLELTTCYDVKSISVLATMEPFSCALSGLLVVGEKNIVVTASRHHSLKIIQVPEGQLLSTHRVDATTVHHLVPVTPGCIACISRSGSVNLLDLQNDTSMLKLSIEADVRYTAASLSFLAVASSDTRVIIVDLELWKPQTLHMSGKCLGLAVLQKTWCCVLYENNLARLALLDMAAVQVVQECDLSSGPLSCVLSSRQSGADWVGLTINQRPLQVMLEVPYTRSGPTSKRRKAD